jgi:hypothetical protein
LLLLIATSVVGALLTPKPHFNQPQPNSLGDFRFPTAQEGRAVPVICGTVKIQGGNTVWWGDLQIVPIKKKVKSGLFSHTTIITGYKYYLGCQFALCEGPIDSLIGMESNKKPVPFTQSGSDPVSIDIDAPNLFGGDTSEGGISGKIVLYRGTDTQGSDAYLSQKQTSASATPTYSGSGNGGLSFLAPGAASVNETITITALSTFDSGGNREFSVVGSSSGSIGTAIADAPFASGQINFTITTGSIAFATGDHWSVQTFTSRVSPSYHGLCYAVFRHLYLGTSSYVKPIAFILKRCPDPLGMGSTFANLNGGDANPVLFLYDLMTNPSYGLGILPGRIDASSFVTAATTCKNENLGISMQIDSQGTADQLLGDILRHCDGILYVDPATGLWTIKLARADYDPTTIPELTVDNVLETSEFSRASWSETTNQVIIKYLDRNANYNTRTVQAQDAANIAVTAEVRTQTIDFNGISNSATAALIATRVLKTLTYPLSKLKITCNRTAWSWRVGGVFKFTWVPLGISDQVYRITRISYGEITDGKITLDAVEDIFGLNFTVFDPPPASGWVNPVGAPVAPTFEKLFEVPYELVPDGVAGIYAMAIVSRTDPTEKSFEVWQPISGSDTETNEVFGFSPVGILAAKYPLATVAKDPTGFVLQLGGIDLNVIASTDEGGLFAGHNLALFEDTGEIVSWKTTTLNMDGTVTISNVLRGVLDTVPTDHAQGTRVYFFTEGSGLTQPNAYPTDLTVQAKILPKNNFGTYPLGSASYISVVTRSRSARPYPPGDLCMQGQAYGTRYTTTVGDVVLTWVSRNRLTQAVGGVLIAQDASAITGETGQTYKVLVVIGGTTVRTIDPATTPFTYAGTDRVSDGGVGPVTLQIFSHANSLDSYMAQTITFEMTGFGLDFGNFFGGIQA